MINSVSLKNFGPIENLDWNNLGRINLVIGNNDCGKSFLLKALYTAIRTIEDFKRGDNPDTNIDILGNKLYWTFQAEKIGDLVNDKGIKKSFELLDEELLLSFSMTFNQQKLDYYFAGDYQLPVISKNQITPRSDNSIFLPSKEILSLHHIILKSRERDMLFGFDDTYLDLARALLQPPTELPLQNATCNSNCNTSLERVYLDPNSTICGHNSNDFNDSREKIGDMIGGRIEFDDFSKRWYFWKNGQRFSIGITAEGIKKIAILDYLLGNGYLSENSIIFIDEPESNLHPEAISKLLDIIAILAKHGIQFFLASHSYFVIKKLFLIAHEQELSIPVLSYENDEWQQADLKDDMPDNPIINESIRLYEEEVDLAFK